MVKFYFPGNFIIMASTHIKTGCIYIFSIFSSGSKKLLFETCFELYFLDF